MARVQLYATRTWKMSQPEPFDKTANQVSTVYYSRYCTASAKKSTLHSPSLSAILAYMEMDTSVTPPLSS